jgi:hypothetical protein
MGFSLSGYGHALAAQADAWKADWEKTLQTAKKEGQLVLYGSADFENLFAEFHKKSKSSASMDGAPTWPRGSCRSGARKDTWPISTSMA